MNVHMTCGQRFATTADFNRHVATCNTLPLVGGMLFSAMAEEIIVLGMSETMTPGEWSIWVGPSVKSLDIHGTWQEIAARNGRPAMIDFDAWASVRSASRVAWAPLGVHWPIDTSIRSVMTEIECERYEREADTCQIDFD